MLRGDTRRDGFSCYLRNWAARICVLDISWGGSTRIGSYPGSCDLVGRKRARYLYARATFLVRGQFGLAARCLEDNARRIIRTPGQTIESKISQENQLDGTLTESVETDDASLLFESALQRISFS